MGRYPCLTYFSEVSDCNSRNVSIGCNINFKWYNNFHILKPLNLNFVGRIRSLLPAFIFFNLEDQFIPIRHTVTASQWKIAFRNTIEAFQSKPYTTPSVFGISTVVGNVTFIFYFLVSKTVFVFAAFCVSLTFQRIIMSSVTVCVPLFTQKQMRLL